jgi:protein-disulfide isomerase
MKLGVSSTPTLLVGGHLYQGQLNSDAIGKLVDSLAR